MKLFLITLLLFSYGCIHANEYPYNEPLENLIGLKMPLGWKPPKEKTVMMEVSLVLPKKFDWREKGVTPAESQGSYGNCWAFAGTAVFQDIVKISTGKTKNFSEQYLVDCNTDGYGPRGGWIPFKYFHSQGYKGGISDSDYPYRGNRYQCKQGLKPIDRLTDHKYLGNVNVETIKQTIYSYGPIWVGVHANNAMQSYRGGIFNGCANGQTNHAVVLLGWNDDQKYFIMKNSWGTRWGENGGFMKIPYNCSKIGEATTFVTYKSNPKPDPDPDPTPDDCDNLTPSKLSKTAVRIKFVNNTKNYRRIYWLNWSGKKKYFVTLKAGKSYYVLTYTGHSWISTDTQNKCKEQFRVTKKSIKQFNINK